MEGTIKKHRNFGGVSKEKKEDCKDAEWLKNFKRDFEYKEEEEEEEEVEITPEKIKKILRKMPNWKVLGPDCIQGFWLKNFKKVLDETCKNA